MSLCSLPAAQARNNLQKKIHAIAQGREVVSVRSLQGGSDAPVLVE
jgi:hypothetical protein